MRETTASAEMIAFAGMVVDDVENDLDARLVQSFHAVLNSAIEPAGKKTRIGREEPNRIVSPIVREGRARRAAVSLTTACIGSNSIAVAPSSIR